MELSLEEVSEELLEFPRYGEVNAVRSLLDAYPDIMSTVDGSGSTAFHKACAQGHVSTAKLLIQRGASSNESKSSLPRKKKAGVVLDFSLSDEPGAPRHPLRTGTPALLMLAHMLIDYVNVVTYLDFMCHSRSPLRTPITLSGNPRSTTLVFGVLLLLWRGG